MMKLHAPHRHIHPNNKKEKFLIALFDCLWERYQKKMAYVRIYEKLIAAKKAKFFNDHVAFRTIAFNSPPLGIFSVSRIFEALGYRSAECYEFPDKHLNATYFQHARSELPKLFVSQLKTWELSSKSQRILYRYLKKSRAGLKEKIINDLHRLPTLSHKKTVGYLKKLSAYFGQLPWPRPQKTDLLQLNEETQYGAWVLVNGYEVNHFTASVNSHGHPDLDNIEGLIREMKRMGIPMKKKIEGDPGSKLRQSSTEAVTIPTIVKSKTKTVSIPWNYAYFEIAERSLFENTKTGISERFEGFLGGQATHLFEMTKIRKKY